MTDKIFSPETYSMIGQWAIGFCKDLVVAVIGYMVSRPKDKVIQGEAEATEYRVSGKVPGRIEMYLYEEGEQVRKGDTLVVIYSPEVEAKKAQAVAAREMAEAVKSTARVTSAYNGCTTRAW